jgi:hypothetical protein
VWSIGEKFGRGEAEKPVAVTQALLAGRDF